MVRASVNGWPLWALALAMAAALSGCASSTGSVRASRPEKPPPPTARPRPRPDPGAPPSRLQTGQASWYGRPHHGQRTASGEIYDMYALTAAHPSLPLGTRVRVTNLRNGRSVVVRINDRGPIVDGRIIDLSYAAARSLDGVEAGTFAVRVRVLSLPGNAPVARPADRRSQESTADRWWVADSEPATCPGTEALTAAMPEGGRARSTPLQARRS